MQRSAEDAGTLGIRRPDLGFWLRWVVANGLGGMVGLGGVFAAGVLIVSFLGEPAGLAGLALLLLLVVGLAVYEGAVVGFAQWWVLRRALPAVAARSWIGATVAGAVAAWLLGMIPSTVGITTTGGGAASSPPAAPSALLVTAVAAAMGAVLGTVLAAPQWRVLRHHVPNAALWLAANALAWAAAMPLIFRLLAATIGERQTPAALALLAVGLGGAGMVVGAVHGVVLVRLVGRAPRHRVPSTSVDG